MHEVIINRTRRIITFKASGTISTPLMKEILEEAKQATDGFKGQPHFVIADLRGLAPLSPETTAIMGEIIKYGRARGTVCCVHLSDSSIARLQASRLAREASPYDDVTVNVVSMEEGERIIAEKEKQLAKAAK